MHAAGLEDGCDAVGADPIIERGAVEADLAEVIVEPPFGVLAERAVDREVVEGDPWCERGLFEGGVTQVVVGVGEMFT